MIPELKEWQDARDREAFKARVCPQCGDVFFRQHSAKTCSPCAFVRQRHGQKAMSAVAKAVKQGLLPRVIDCICVDCGAPAKAYDHRDYSKPLEVEPVCDSCNQKRGPAKLCIESKQAA